MNQMMTPSEKLSALKNHAIRGRVLRSVRAALRDWCSMKGLPMPVAQCLERQVAAPAMTFYSDGMLEIVAAGLGSHRKLWLTWPDLEVQLVARPSMRPLVEPIFRWEAQAAD
jgi:hypothetical protein